MSLYNIGADPDSQNSPPALRCPRHLLMGCEICVEAKTSSRPAGEKKRSGGLSKGYSAVATTQLGVPVAQVMQQQEINAR